MSWRFVYCPSCSTAQQKVGGAEQVMFCADCCTEWVEDRQKRKKAKKGKKKH